jgi:hypothetical protein
MRANGGNRYNEIRISRNNIDFVIRRGHVSNAPER